MNRNQLVNKLEMIREPRIVEIVHANIPDMRKTNNPYLFAVKVQHIRGIINFNYEGAMNAAVQLPEGFKAGPRIWGIRIPNTPLVQHNDKVYLEVLVQTKIEPDRYMNQGQPLDEDLIRPFLKGKPAEQEPLVRPRDFKIDGIVEIDFGEGRCIIDT